ncbi:MAG: glycosyltransferase family 39 protein [Acidobacteria bacterium]|nr:glycosyltransferase family 39 protein [Acidobacteriota bacterium]
MNSSPRTLSTATLILIGLAAFKLFLHFYVNTFTAYGFFRDELYFLACGEHLAWGYVDQPPLVAVVAWATRALLGDSLFAIRFFPAVAGALRLIVVGLMARELGGGRFAQVIAALTVLVSAVYLAHDSFLSMNTFEQLLWTLAAYLLVVILKRDEPRLWIPFGAVVGLGLLNKYSMFFFGAALVVALVLTPARKYFRSRWLYAGGAFALLIALPNLAWQYQHGWPQLELLRNADAMKNAPFAVATFLFGSVLQMNPHNIPIWLAGVCFFLFMRDGKPYRALGWQFLAVVGLLILGRGKPYYLAPAYPPLLAAGALVCERFFNARRWNWAKPALVVFLLIGGVMIAPFGLPILPVETFIRYKNALGVKEIETERHRKGPLPQFYADMHGWPEMVAEVAKVYNSLPLLERGRTAIYCNNYGEAGAIDFFGPVYSLPKAISGHNNYWLWGPGKSKAEIVITVGEPREDVEKSFEQVEEAGKINHPYAMPYENGSPIYIARKPKFSSIKEIWPRTKKFI